MCTDPHPAQTLIFFDELRISLSKVVNKFNNFIDVGDFDRDITKEVCSGYFHMLEEF